MFVEADRDEVARALVARLTDEVAAFVRATIDRLELGGLVPEILLGGGLMQAANGRLVRDTASCLAGMGLDVEVRAVSSPPIVGAALLALDDVGADPAAHERVRSELERAAAEQGWVPGVPADDDALVATPASSGPSADRG